MSNSQKFESSFTGLDLSEFASETKSSTSTRTISASAQLIKVKKAEALRKRHDEEEEALMQDKAAEKVQVQLDRLKTAEDQKENGQVGGFFDALISMHGEDRSGGKKIMNKSRSKTKTKAQKRSAVSKFKTSLSKVQVSKKGQLKKRR